MFNVITSSTRPALAEVPVEMPLNILLALPEYVTRDPAAPVFNLPGAIALLLGQLGWERASKILNLRIWAPGWNDAGLERFVTSAFLDHPELFRGAPAAGLRVSDFPDIADARPPSTPGLTRFDIIHFTGHVEWKDGERALKVTESDDEWMDARSVASAFGATRTRLVILQVPSRHFENAVGLSKEVVDRQVPAVVVVASRNAAAVNVYLTDLFADIVHNKELEEVARPKLLVDQGAQAPPTPLDLTVQLVHGQACGDILQFTRWLTSLQQRLNQLRADAATRAAPQAAQITELRSKLSQRRLHASQVSNLEAKLVDADQRIPELLATVEAVGTELQSGLNWAQESGGAEWLSRIADLLPTLEARAAELESLYPGLEEGIRVAEQRAPRVLNANFCEPGPSRILGPLEGLVAGQEYDLLVDIGPVWNTVASIVSGNSAFPEQALPPEGEGHRIEVVFVSDAFMPNLVTGRLWLPRDRGRSHPFVDDQPAAEPGPISLRIKAPAFPSDHVGSIYEAHGRLLLYYENNLLQSATVTVGVVRTPGAVLKRQNAIQVDFVLTATFSELRDRFAERNVRFGPEGSRARHAITLNITLNQDAGGTHRILVRGRDDLSPAWMAYDPIAARANLETARTTLLDCYWLRDENGAFVFDRHGERVPGLHARTGKTLAQFRLDLLFLARVGETLYAQMLQGLRTGSQDERPADWERKLRERLSASEVIQIARIESTPTQYAYPWALLYEYSLHGTSDQIRWCDVLWEWSEEGLREKPTGRSCPFADRPWHQENVLCPFGFWGLKHMIEQPLAPAAGKDELREALSEITIDRDISLSVGWTRDAALNLSQVDAHVQKISRIRGVRLASPPPNPADDRNTVRAVLATTNLAYFICHCEREPTENEPYLYVGPRDDQEVHKIYAKTVQGWGRSTLAGWGKLRPLVFINGCHTSDLRPGEVLNFVSAFALAGAAGIIGTEVSVQLPVATEIAELLFEKLVAGDRLGEPIGLGQAMREIRWELANKGNLFGLCYTPYGLADLHVVRR